MLAAGDLKKGQCLFPPTSATKEFYFGHVMVGSKKVMEWNNMMENFGGYSDTGTSSLKALVFDGFWGVWFSRVSPKGKTSW